MLQRLLIVANDLQTIPVQRFIVSWIETEPQLTFDVLEQKLPSAGRDEAGVGICRQGREETVPESVGRFQMRVTAQELGQKGETEEISNLCSRLMTAEGCGWIALRPLSVFLKLTDSDGGIREPKVGRLLVETQSFRMVRGDILVAPR